MKDGLENFAMRKHVYFHKIRNAQEMDYAKMEHAYVIIFILEKIVVLSCALMTALIKVIA